MFGSVSTEAPGSSSNNQQCRQINDSLYELYTPPGIPTVQIVLFHGLQLGDYEDAHLSTWRCEDGSCIWPSTWLVEDIPGAYVLSVLYGKCLSNVSDGAVDLYIIRENLLTDLLEAEIGQESNCPVILVGHSIGGLVIKQVCLHAHDMLHRSRGLEKMKFQAFVNNVKGIFYYSTPHHGSPLAEKLAERLGHSPLLTYFKTLSTINARLSFEFDAICKVYNEWLLAGIGETCTTNLGPFQGIVAPEASTRRGVVNFNLMDGEDHFSICRPKNKFARNFLKLKGFVIQATASLQSPAARNAELTQSNLPHSVEGLIRGLINGLIDSLSLRNNSAVQEHLEILANRAYYDDPSRVAIANRIGIFALLAKLLENDEIGIMKRTTRLLFVLIAGEEDDEIRSRIVQYSGALPALVKSLSALRYPDLQANTTGVLASLADGNQVTKEAIANEPGAIAGLVKLLSTQKNSKTRTQAGRAF